MGGFELWTSVLRAWASTIVLMLNSYKYLEFIKIYSTFQKNLEEKM